MAVYPRQQKFIGYYEGDEKQAALLAGYKVPAMDGPRNLKNPDIVKAIKLRDQEERDPRIMNRLERMVALTNIARDMEQETKDRIKSIETLCKMSGDFIQVHEVGIADDAQQTFREEVRAATIEFFNAQLAANHSNVIIDAEEINDEDYENMNGGD